MNMERILTWFIFLGIIIVVSVLSYKYGKYREQIISMHYEKRVLPMKNALLARWIKNRNDGIHIYDVLLEKKINTVAIYGSAILGQLLYGELKQSSIEIISFIDRKANNKNEAYDGVPILTMVEYLKKYDADAIIITPLLVDGESIEEQLMAKGVDCKRIIQLSSLVWCEDILRRTE